MNRIETGRLLIETYDQTGSYSETAREWGTSRHVVRKWVRRFRQQGEAGLQDLSRRPHRSPRQTPAEIEQQVMEAWEKTRYISQGLDSYSQVHSRQAWSQEGFSCLGVGLRPDTGNCASS